MATLLILRCNEADNASFNFALGNIKRCDGGKLTRCYIIAETCGFTMDNNLILNALACDKFHHFTDIILIKLTLFIIGRNIRYHTCLNFVDYNIVTILKGRYHFILKIRAALTHHIYRCLNTP